MISCPDCAEYECQLTKALDDCERLQALLRNAVDDYERAVKIIEDLNVRIKNLEMRNGGKNGAKS